MSTYTEHLISLAEALCGHDNVSHWAVSMRLTGKGDLIDRLKKGGDVRTATYEELMRKFASTWPVDLSWPTGVPHPSKGERAA